MARPFTLEVVMPPVVVLKTWRGDEIHFADYETYRRAWDLCKVRCRTLLELIRQLTVFDIRPEWDWRWIEAWKNGRPAA